MNEIIIEYREDDDVKRRYVCSSISEAVMAIGLIDRHENMPTEEEATAEKVKNF